ncbi:UNVERIFIED_CONTAM: hypothetical protein NY603_19725, partial [Bacteroidetes bacterium 56_B9]
HIITVRSIHVKVSLENSLLEMIWSDLLLWLWHFSCWWLHDCHALAAIMFQSGGWRGSGIVIAEQGAASD